MTLSVSESCLDGMIENCFFIAMKRKFIYLYPRSWQNVRRENIFVLDQNFNKLLENSQFNYFYFYYGETWYIATVRRRHGETKLRLLVAAIRIRVGLALSLPALHGLRLRLLALHRLRLPLSTLHGFRLPLSALHRLRLPLPALYRLRLPLLALHWLKLPLLAPHRLRLPLTALHWL